MLNPNFNKIELSFNSNEHERYLRHFTLPFIIIEGQKRLKASKILFVGAGGLASTALLYLAASGIGCIGLIDKDIVDLSNLQRQIIYDKNELKTLSAQESVKRINTNSNVIVYNELLSTENSHQIIKNYDIIIDATDNIETRYVIDQTCTSLQKPWSKILFGVFNYQQNLKYSDFNINLSENCNNCQNNGVLSVCKIIIAIFPVAQKIDSVNLIYSIGIFQATDIEFKKIKAYSNISHKLNSRRKVSKDNSLNIKRDLTYQATQSTNHKKKRRELMIDIRTKYEFDNFQNQHKTSDIVHIPLTLLFNDQNINFLKEESLKKSIIIYCTSHSRALFAIGLLKKYNIIAHTVFK
uniref:molybdopterin biosynthesis protein n=1 Tax=Erythrolobus coxiae TaxID=362235 RepID=UPI001FCDD152|nr:molybdopterin biosynthesis protein [Erythrolobus coxiae]UNJ17726.1 molybdopterin biosynthesis protein [Erythrolobus coxiae]